MQAITRAIEAQDRLVEEAKTGIVETALGTNECAPLFLLLKSLFAALPPQHHQVLLLKVLRRHALLEVLHQGKQHHEYRCVCRV